MTDHAKEFDRIYRQAKRDGKTMSPLERITAFVFSGISLLGGVMILRALLVDPVLRVFPADLVWLPASLVLFFFCVGGFLAYVATVTPSPPKEPA